MKDFKGKFKAILQELKLAEKAAKNALTQEDWTRIAEAYKAKYNSDFYEDQQKAETERRGSIHGAALALLNNDVDDDEDEPTDDTGTTGSAAGTDLTAQAQKLKEEKEALEKKNKGLTEKVAQLEAKPEDDNPRIETVTIGLAGPGTNDKHLFGIPADMFSMEHRWNKVAANPRFATLTEVDEQSDGSKFQDAVRLYGKSLAERYQHLHETGQLAGLVKGAALDVGYSDLDDAGLGKQFIIRRQDELIARIKEVPTVYDLFPRRYGVQDRELITNAFFGEFSQAYQAGEVWKGTVDLQPELGHVDDVMFKTLFNSMKWIERQYIGYLNSEGSDPVKWSMIEWMVLRIATVLVNEQSKRRVMGHYVTPDSTVAGNALFGSTGVVHTLIRYVHEFKLLPLSHSSYNTYDNTLSTMVDAVNLFLADALEKRGNLNGFAVYLNENHKMWYRAGVRRTYGKDFDFTGPKGETVVDWDVPIKWVPNMGQVKLIFLQKPGNIQCLEFVPGEMFKIQFDRDMEAVKSWATWKEGVSAAFAGKVFADLATLTANDYDLQEIFINKPATSLVADATTASALVNFWFLTIANSGATAITDITGAKDGEVYIIECGSATNATTIAKADKFSTLSAAWTPTAAGDYIKLHYNATTSKFYDLERCVGGVRSIVSAKQPNIKGATR
ncbi:MAG: hypothetical protein V2B15_08655 [Bacteroidota bacterium]